MNAHSPAALDLAVAGVAFDPLWTIPIMGGAVCGLAFLLGRHFLVGGKAAPEGANVLALNENYLKGVTTERRAAPRRKGNAIEVYLSESGDEHMAAWVLDRSMGGLCLLVEAPLTEGLSLKIRPRHAPEGTPWTPIVVKTCRPESQFQWEVGCQFLRPPTWGVLLLFG